MVRLEVNVFILVWLFGCVSIPIWCDWKCVKTYMIGRTLKFQFLYGAIGRRQLLAPF